MGPLPDDIRRILLIRTDRMGDVLMCLPAIHAIRKRFPQAQITLLLQKDLRALLDEHPDIDQLLSWNPDEGTGWLSSFRWGICLRREKFDAAVVFNATRLFHAAVFLANVPIRVGYSRKWGFLLSRSIADTKVKRNLHEVEYNLELARLLGALPAEQAVYKIEISQTAQREASGILESAGIPAPCRPIAIHPWTSNPVKSWPLNSFVELARRIGEKNEFVIAIGGADSRGLLSASEKGNDRQIIDLTGKVSLKALPALLSRCRLLISNDSGPAHVAAAVGTPTLILAPREHGPQLERWRPWGNTHRILLSPTVEEAAEAVQKGLQP